MQAYQEAALTLSALIVGGCPAPYHRLEPAAPHILSALNELQIEAHVTGIYHPDGGDAFTGDYASLTDDGLAGRPLLVLYTTGNERFGADPSAIVRFVRGGGALVGIHCAADSFTDDAEFVRLIGGKFRTHPPQLPITLEITDSGHSVTEGLQGFTVVDELYLFADYDPANLHLLAQTRSFDDNGPVPLCWVREEGVGRVFYLSLGHNPETLADPSWRALFKRGVHWALGAK